MAIEPKTKNGKAVGTRNHVVVWLAAHGDLDDPSGMASTTLARNIGYPGSSIAFAQLLSGMERSGLIVREVRGKRTYRVALTEAGRERAQSGGRSTPNRRGGIRHAEPGDAGVDYDELARRLLLQVANRLVGDGGPGGGLGDGDPAEWHVDGTARPETAGARNQLDALERRLRALEVELAHARTARLALEGENEELRSQLERIRSNLGGDTRRGLSHGVARQPAHDDVDVALLKQMLVEREGGGQGGRDKIDKFDTA